MLNTRIFLSHAVFNLVGPTGGGVEILVLLKKMYVPYNVIDNFDHSDMNALHCNKCYRQESITEWL